MSDHALPAVVEAHPALIPHVTDAATCAAAYLTSFANASTRSAYGRDLRRWGEWLEHLGVDVLAAERVHVEAWMRQMDADGLSAATQARRVASVSGFYARALDERLVDRDPAGRVKRPRVADTSQALGLDREQVAALLRAAAADGRRAHALLILLATTGCRVSEALAIDLADLGQQRGHRTVVLRRKRGKVQTVPLAPFAAAAIDALADDLDGPGPLFRTRTGGRLDRQAAFRLVARLGREAGISGAVGPHALRHAWVTLALDSGAQLRDVQDGAGHADPRTTRRYDRGRGELDRSPNYAVAAALA
jgi:site-specific recombinase XerD